MGLPVRVFPSSVVLGRALAAEVASLYERAQGDFLLGCAAGRHISRDNLARSRAARAGSTGS